MISPFLPLPRQRAPMVELLATIGLPLVGCAILFGLLSKAITEYADPLGPFMYHYQIPSETWQLE